MKFKTFIEITDQFPQLFVNDINNTMKLNERQYQMLLSVAKGEVASVESTPTSRALARRDLLKEDGSGFKASEGAFAEALRQIRKKAQTVRGMELPEAKKVLIECSIALSEVRLRNTFWWDRWQMFEDSDRVR